MVDVYARLCAITNKHSMPTNITQPQPVAFAKMQEQFVHWLSNGTISVFLASQNFITTHTKKNTTTNNLCFTTKANGELEILYCV